MQEEQGETVHLPYWHSTWRIETPIFRTSWTKTMMWLFLISDALTFAGLLGAYGMIRVSSPKWPDTQKVFSALPFVHVEVPLLLIAFMTFILICSSVTMALAVDASRRKDKAATVKFLLLTILGGLTFLSCQAFEWTHLISHGSSLTNNPWKVPMFTACFFIITGFHGAHVSSGVLYLLGMIAKVLRGTAGEDSVEVCGLYWHFVDLVWVFIFTFFYLF